MSTDRGRVLITGIGAITPFGRGVAAFWAGLVEGRLAPARLDPYEAPANLDAEARSHLGRASLFAADAAIEAIENAALPFTAQTAPLIGVILGSDFGEQERPVPGAPAASVARVLGVAGPVLSLSGPASGLAAVAQGYEMVKSGACPVAVVGGVDIPSSLAQGGPAGVPFDAARTGPRLSEAACVIILEDSDVATGRGARVLAEVLGCGSTFSRATVMQPAPNFVDAARAMRAALLRGEVFQGEVETVFASAAGDPEGDAIEFRALADLWGPNVDRLTVTSALAASGYAAAAGGPLSLAAAVRSLTEGVVPAVTGLSTPDPTFDRLDLVTGEPRPWRYNTALVNAFSEAANISIVLRRT